jgi:hypothetical protein
MQIHRQQPWPGSEPWVNLRKNGAANHASKATGSGWVSCHGAILPLSSVCNRDRGQQALDEFLTGDPSRKENEQFAAFGVVDEDCVRAAQHGAKVGGVQLRQALAIQRKRIFDDELEVLDGAKKRVRRGIAEMLKQTLRVHGIVRIDAKLAIRMGKQSGVPRRNKSA